MDAKRSWAHSAAIHGVLLLGAALMATSVPFEAGDSEGSGLSCRLGDPTPRFDRIDRPKDQFGSRIPSAEESPMTEISAPAGGPLVDDRDRWSERWSDCCECYCGGAATTIVAWPRDIVGYFDRKLSMATSRKGAPRLKTHSRHCGFKDTGNEVDCTCGLIPPRN
jgi:hypothetical protein